ncbi:two-component regulator propeller domain-containing protein [Thermomonas sp. LB-4]|uniref:two-component regulator propeller domain-containing protein n=1 Tax=Thermomonas sp. LB-4 TaxID=3102790 RepID=UPI002ED83394
MSAGGVRRALGLVAFGLLILSCAWLAAPKHATAAMQATPVRTTAPPRPEKPISAFYRETWTTRQGLPHNQINAIAQTPDGYLWLGTWEGLVRYNGLEFHQFDRGNTPALRDNGVRSVRAAANGAVVVGTSRGGVAVKQGDRWRSWTSADGLAQDEILDAVLDRHGRLWAATESMGLSMLERGRALQFNVANGRLPSDVVFSLLEDRDGSMWVATAAGLVHVVGGRAIRVGALAGLPQAPVFRLLQTRAGVLLVGTERGVYRRDASSGRFVQLSPRLPEDGVPSLAEDNAGHLWIGTVNNGLFRLAGSGVEHFTSRRELPNNRVASLLADREGSIWVGTNAGLMRLSDAPFTTWNSDQGLSDDYVRALAAAPDGGIWIGTGRGLNLWRNNAIVAGYTKADGLPGDSILSLLQARDGSLLVGTYTDGVLRLRDGQVVARYDSADGMPGSNQIRALAEGKDGTVWIGTTRGLVRLRDGQFRGFGVAQGLPREFIIALHVAGDGTLWVGTSNGVARVVDDEVLPLEANLVRGAQDVFDFHEDADGTMWLATDRGLLRYRQGRIRGLSLEHGLPVDTLFAILDDGLGYLWLASNRGVLRIARDEAEAVLGGRRAQLTVDHFGEADGLVSSQCNGGSGPAAMRDGRGNLWIATARGAAAVDPGALQSYRHALPHVVVEQVLADGKPVHLDEVLRLPAGTRKLEFRFAAVSFQMPRFLRYRYQLEGFDPGWVERGNLRSAQYTNLDPGNYRFHVNVSAPGLDQGWSSEVTGVAIEIAPQPWQRRGFIVAAILLGLACVYAVYLWRVGSLRRRAARLEETVAERTHDLRLHAERLRESDLEKSVLLDKLGQQSEAFARMALEDALTGVGNRRSLDAELQLAFARALRTRRPLCFALFDIDHFKQINDRYSHAAGDQALVAVAHALRDALDGAGMLARWGGEEFAVLFERIPLERAREICEAMRQRVEAIDCSAYAPERRLSVSAGIAERAGAVRIEDLVARADALLYEAKRAGRNRIAG